MSISSAFYSNLVQRLRIDAEDAAGFAVVKLRNVFQEDLSVLRERLDLEVGVQCPCLSLCLCLDAVRGDLPDLACVEIVRRELLLFQKLCSVSLIRNHEHRTNGTNRLICINAA